MLLCLNCTALCFHLGSLLWSHFSKGSDKQAKLRHGMVCNLNKMMFYNFVWITTGTIGGRNPHWSICWVTHWPWSLSSRSHGTKASPWPRHCPPSAQAWPCPLGYPTYSRLRNWRPALALSASAELTKLINPARTPPLTQRQSVQQLPLVWELIHVPPCWENTQVANGVCCFLMYVELHVREVVYQHSVMV